jgi:hypothetical protein
MSATVFAGPAAVNVFVAITLKSGINLYMKTGMKPNRMWTPSAMLAKAGQITGKTFKRGQYQQAIDALEIWIDENRAQADISQA